MGGGAAVAAPLAIETVVSEANSSAPAALTIEKLVALCEANESRIESGSYEAVQQSSVPTESTGLFADPDFAISTQTLFFKGAKVRTKRIYGNAGGAVSHDDEWAFDGTSLRSLSETSEGGLIQENEGQLYGIAHWFRDLNSPLGFASEGVLSVWIRDLYEKYPAELSIVQCEHPSRGKVVMLDVKPSHRIFFDPRQHHACFGQILYANRDKDEILRCYEVDTTVRAGGVTMPAVIRAASFDWATDKVWRRMREVTIRFADWGVNPKLDERMFTMEIPVEYHVYDSINERVVTAEGPAAPNRWRWVAIAVCVASLGLLVGLRALGRRGR